MAEQRDTPGAPNYRPFRGTSVAGAQHGRPLRPYSYGGNQWIQADPVERFWSKVNTAGECWEWTAYKRDGYGLFRFDGRDVAAHRWSFEQANGPIPAGMLVDHECHNRGCVNPAHLRLATPRANQEYRKGATRSNKRTGVRGVYPSGRGYMVKIQHRGKQIYLGTYDTIPEAEAVAIRERNRRFTFAEKEKGQPIMRRARPRKAAA